MKSSLIKSVCGLALAAVSLPSHSALIGRDLDTGIAGFEAYYDTVLDITWLGDANYAQTSGHDADGRMTWGNAVSWADSLSLYGYNDWRLPTMMDTGAPGCEVVATSGTDCGYNVQTGSAATTVYSEMASLFYDTLGNQGYLDSSGNTQSTYGLQNTGPFTNAQSHSYWSGVEYAPRPWEAWAFTTHFGYQGAGIKDDAELYAWAVRSGDVSAVPVPAAVWLLGSGLVGLVGYRRYKR